MPTRESSAAFRRAQFERAVVFQKALNDREFCHVALGRRAAERGNVLRFYMEVSL